jgi:hypothetical protein
MKRAVFYIASKEDQGRYLAEAAYSAASVKKVLGLPIVLFTDNPRPPMDQNFDDVRKLPDQRGPFWYLDQVRYFNIAVNALTDYEELLYLDVDTYVAWPCLNIFDVLRQFDMAGGQSASRDAIESALDVPESFCTPQVGVNPLRNTERVRRFIGDWLAMYEAHYARYDNNDEAALRDTLWLNEAGIRWCTLAPEFALRFDFGCWVKGWVRILHGRVGGISSNREPLEPVGIAINEHCRMRVWNHRLLQPGE